MIIIKSQNREFLGECNRLTITRTENCRDGEYSILEQTGYDSYTELGIYKTKIRALEVLDRIHAQVTRDVARDYMSNNYRVFQKYVFEMPIK